MATVASTCVNHPDKGATHRCKRCSKPICSACVRNTELGQFCSQECYDAVAEFQQRVMQMRGAKKGWFDLGAIVKQIGTAAIILGAVWASFYFLYGDQTPAEIWARMVGWYKQAVGP